MATIDSYVVHSRINAASPRARRRVLLGTVAGVLGLAIVAGAVFAGHAGAPWRPKFEARVAADTTPYPSNRDASVQEDDSGIAAFQQSVAISHLTSLAPAAIETARPVVAVAKPAHVQKMAATVVRKSAPAPSPPPRPISPELTVAEKSAPPRAAPPMAPAQKKPVLIEIVNRIEHAPDRVVDFAAGVTARVFSLRAKVGL